MEERNRGKYSPALLEAQKKLEYLRCQHQSTSNEAGWSSGDRGRFFSGYPHKLDSNHPHSFTRERAEPSHLSPLEQSPHRAPVEDAGKDRSNSCSYPPPERTEPAKELRFDLTRDRCIKLHPNIALGMLSQEVVSAGRIWLLLQFIDKDGSGWVTLESARKTLTDEDAELRICGRRQLRKLLSRGEGLFWRRNDGRIWLKSAAKVAASLNVQRLTGSPIALPIGELLKGIGHARAHFYASFHSGRNKEPRDGKRSNPIARSTLQRLSRSSRRSQQRYERRAGIEAQSNIAIGAASTLENDQQTAWKHGTAAFRFNDSAGKMGKKGVVYSAWQLPNNYTGPHATLPKGNQKRINRALADLFMKGMMGNGKSSSGFNKGSGHETRQLEDKPIQLYHKHGLSAATSFTRYPDIDAYWPERPGGIGHYRRGAIGPYRRWFTVSGISNG